jgi:hypothetical protein
MKVHEGLRTGAIKELSRARKNTMEEFLLLLQLWPQRTGKDLWQSWIIKQV